MEIATGKVVLFNYTLTNKEGDILDTSVGVEPLHYIHGDGTLIKGLEMALGGRKKGDKFQIIIEPMDAYGDYNDDLVQDVPKSEFEPIENIAVGTDIEIDIASDDGVESIPAKVVNISTDTITLDMNHPLAGELLHFDIDIKDVRDPLPEEEDTGQILQLPSDNS